MLSGEAYEKFMRDIQKRIDEADLKGKGRGHHQEHDRQLQQRACRANIIQTVTELSCVQLKRCR